MNRLMKMPDTIKIKLLLSIYQCFATNKRTIEELMKIIRPVSFIDIGQDPFSDRRYLKTDYDI